MIEGPSIRIPLEPALDARRMNAIVAEMKKSLGPIGKDIKPIDAKSLNAELAKIEAEMKGLDKQFERAFSAGSVEEMRDAVAGLLKDIEGLDNAGGKEPFADRFFKAEAIGQGAELLGQLAQSSNDTRDAMRQLGAQTGLTGAELEQLKTIAGNVYERGGFDSMAEAIKATGTAAQQLREFLDPQGIEDFVSAAGGISKTFDKDVNEVISKSRTFIAAFGLEGAEAGNLISLAMQKGGSGMDDVLDSLDEYSQLAADAGISAEQFVGTLISGVQAGTRDTDKLADAIKETGLRLNQGDAVKALSEIEGATARTLESIARKAESGDIGIGEAIQRSAEIIDEAELSDAMKQKLQVAVTGTQAEDIGVSLYNKIFSAPIDEAAITAQAQQAGQQIADAAEPKDIFSSIEKKAQRVFGDIAGFIGPTLGPASQLTGTLAKIGPALEAANAAKAAKGMAGYGQATIGVIKNLLGMTVATGAQTVATGTQTAATGGATVATGALGLAMRALPIFALIGAIGLVAAAFGAFSTSTEEIVEDLDSAREAGKKARDELSKSFTDTAASDKSAKSLKSLADEFRSLEGSTTTEGQERFAAVSEELANKVPHAKQAVDDFNQAGKETSDVYGINANVVDQFADAQLRQNAAIRQGAIAEAGLRMKELAEASADARERQEEITEKIQQQQDLIDKAADNPDNQFLADMAERAGEKLVELEAELGQVTTGLGAADEESRNIVTALQDGKVSMEEIARVSGKPVEEIERMAKEAKIADGEFEAVASSAGEIEKGAKGAASATDRIGAAAERSKKIVKELAAVYEQVRQAADSAYSGAFNGVLGIMEKQRAVAREIELIQIQIAEAASSANLPRLGLLNSQLASLRNQAQVLEVMEEREKNAARNALAEKRRLEAQERALKIELGEIIIDAKPDSSGVTDFREQAEQIRRQIDDVLFGIVNESLGDQLQAQINQVNQTLKQELKKIDDDINKVRTTKGATKGASELITELNRLKQVKESEAQAEITRLQIEGQDNRLDELRSYLADRNRLVEAGIDRHIATLEREAARIVVTDEATFALALQKRLQILDLQSAKEVDAIIRNNEFFLRAQEQVQQARRDLDAAETDAQRAEARARLNEAQRAASDVRTALAEGDIDFFRNLAGDDSYLADLRQKRAEALQAVADGTTEAEREAAQNRVAGLDEQIRVQERYLDDLIEVTQSGHEDLLAQDEQTAEKGLAIRNELGNDLLASEERRLEREIALEEAASARKADIARRQYEAVIGGVSTALGLNVDAELAEQLERLDRIKEEELLSEESYQRKKTEIEAEAQKRRTLITAQEEGARAAIEIAAAEAELERERQLLESKLEIAQRLGLTDRAAELEGDLELVKEQIKAKGSEIAAIADELSPKLGDAFAGLFSGSSEQAKEGFRDYFAGLASGLQQLASAKISEVLLNSIGPGGFLGLAASFALRPLISAALNAITQPIIDKLLSFASGGRVDSPTLFVAGDASRLGGRDREWIFRDDQLKLLVAAVSQGSTAQMEQRLESIEDVLVAWPNQLVAQGKDLRLAAERDKQSRATIGPFARPR